MCQITMQLLNFDKMKNKKTKSIIGTVSAVIFVAALVFCILFFSHFKRESNTLEITEQPHNVTVENGYYASFFVEANGDELTFLWQTQNENGVWCDIEKESSQTLSLLVYLGMNESRYRCVITSNAEESVISDEAVLFVSEDHVFSEPLITKTPDCLNGGEQIEICQSCSYKQTQELPPAGHDFGVTEKKNYKLFECKRCAYVYQTEIVDFSALDEVLSKIPLNYMHYYNEEAANEINSIVTKLESSVYGVTAYARLSQSQADSFAQQLEIALEKLTLNIKNYPVIYVNSLDTTTEFIFADPTGKSVSVSGSIEEIYNENTEKRSRLIVLSEKAELFTGRECKNIALLACAADPTLMRTAIGFCAANVLELSEVPTFTYCELWIDGENKGVYLFCEGGFVENEKFLTSGVNEDADAFIEKNADKLKNASYEEICEVIDVDSFAKLQILCEFFTLYSTEDVNPYFYVKDEKLYAGTLMNFDSSAGNCLPETKEIKTEDICELYSVLWSKEEFGELFEQTQKSFSNKLLSLCSSSGTLDKLYKSSKNALTANLELFPLAPTSHSDYIFVSGETIQSNIEFLRNELSKKR